MNYKYDKKDIFEYSLFNTHIHNSMFTINYD